MWPCSSPAVCQLLARSWESILTFSMPRISENPFSVTWPWWLTLIFKVKPIFFKFVLFSRSTIIATLFISGFFEFLDLDYVKINTKIKSVACIQPEIIKVIWKYVWPLFSRSTVEVRWQMSVILRFPTSDILKSKARMILFHAYNPWWTRGHNK